MRCCLKRLLLVTFLVFLWATPARAQDDLTGRFGAGVNWQGFQAKYGIAEDWLAEAKIQFASNNTTAGARVYRLFPSIPRMLLDARPYVGGEFNWVFSDYLDGGILTGPFGGLEFLPAKNLGLELDVGFYYENLWSRIGSVVDVGIIVNLGVTLYF